MQKVAAVFLLAMLGLSCAPAAKFMSPQYARPATIALLPTINQSVDVDGAIVFRNLLYLALKEKQYAAIMENAEVDSLLNEQGITDGGQLTAMSNAELLKTLRVDGIVFIDLLACEYKTLGFSETRKVEAAFKLQTAAGLIWEDERKVDHGKSGMDAAFGAVFDPMGTLKESASDLGQQLVIKGLKGWLLDHALKPEMQEVIQTTVRTLR